MEFPEVNQSFDNKDREVLLQKGFDVRELGTKVRELAAHWQTIGKVAGSEGGMNGGGVKTELRVGVEASGIGGPGIDGSSADRQDQQVSANFKILGFLYWLKSEQSNNHIPLLMQLH